MVRRRRCSGQRFEVQDEDFDVQCQSRVKAPHEPSNSNTSSIYLKRNSIKLYSRH
jgi:hypothetical protein